MDGWCHHIAQPASWTDLAFLQVAADCFQVALLIHTVNDLSTVGSLGAILPCHHSAPVALLEVGMWMGRHLVAIVTADGTSGGAGGTSGDTLRPPAPTSGILAVGRNEWPPAPARFLPAGGGTAGPIPSRSPLTIEQVSALLRSAAPPTVLVACEFSGALISALAAQGHNAISCDLRPAEHSFPHYQGDVRDIVHLQRWERAYFFPNCFQHLRGDEHCLRHKIHDCRAFWAAAMVLWCLACPHADIVVVEQPDTIVYDYADVSAFAALHEFRTSQYGDPAQHDKFVRLAVRNATLTPPSHPVSRQPYRATHLDYLNPDARDRARSSWACHTLTCRALAGLQQRPPVEAPTYIALLAVFVSTWFRSGHPVPSDYLNEDAQPTSPGWREYQLVRGPGDGRRPPLLEQAPYEESTGEDIENSFGALKTDHRRFAAPTLPMLPENGEQGTPYTRSHDRPTSLARISRYSAHALSPGRSIQSTLTSVIPTGQPRWLAPRVPWAASRTIGQMTGLLGSRLAHQLGSRLAHQPPSWLRAIKTHPPYPTGTQGSQSGALHLPREQTVDSRGYTEGIAILLFVCAIAEPLVLAHANGFTSAGLVLPAASPRSRAMRLITHLSGSVVSAALYLPFMIGQYAPGAMLFATPVDFTPPTNVVVRSPTQRAQALAAGAAFVWCTMGALAGVPLGDPATRAILSCRMFQSPGTPTPGVPLLAAVEFAFGVTKLRSLQQRPDPDHPRAGAAARALRAATLADAALRQALDASADDPLLEGWADRITPLVIGEVPPHLLENLPDFSDARLDNVLLSQVLRPLTTAWYPLPPEQPAGPPGKCPSDAYELLTPEGAARLSAWVAHQLRDLAHIRSELARGVKPADVVRDRPGAIAIGQSEFRDWARGRVWDCTLDRSPCCVVAAVSEPPLEIISRDEVRRRLEHYPDQALVSHLLLGARIDADVELQFVLIPHLTTLPFGFQSVMSEIDRLEGYQWYRSFSTLPYAPMYLNGQGSTARKLEPDRWRRTTEGGGPRHPTFDAGGVRALSLNEAARIYHMPEHFVADRRPEFLAWLSQRGLPRENPIPPADGRRHPTKWPKEVKPSLEDVMRDMAVLGRAAARWGTAVYCSNDDIKDYFNHLAVATSELSKVGILLDRADGSGPRFVSERVLGFGLHGSSNLAQRLSDALVVLYYEDMDSEYFAPGASFSAAEQEWLEHRLAMQRREGEPCVDIRQWTASPRDRKLEIPAPPHLRDIPPGYVCPQLRPYRCYFFTDDAQMLAVGIRLKILSLRVWRRLTNRMRLRMAIAEKRSLGTWCKWIGVLLITSLGLVVVTRDKILRASAAITEALSNLMEFHAYRSLCGLLEHLRAVNLRGRNVMHGLYRPHGPGGASQDGPTGVVTCDTLMRGQLMRWRHLLTDSCGVSVKRALKRENLETLPSVSFELFSDACYADIAIPGIGGYMHGLHYYFPVPLADVPLLSIPILEFLGACFNVLTFHSHLHHLGSSSAPAWVNLYTDAFTTARVLTAESAKSAVIVEAYQRLSASPEWHDLYGRLRVAHVFGDANVLADLISRAKWAEFKQLCAMLGVHPQLLQVPAAVGELYRAVVTFLRERAHLGATARGVFNPHLIGDQPIAQGDMTTVGSSLADLMHAQLHPAPPLVLASEALPRVRANVSAEGHLAFLMHEALSPPRPTDHRPTEAPSARCSPTSVISSDGPPAAMPSGRRAREADLISPAKRLLVLPGPGRRVGSLRLPPAPPWQHAQSSSLAAASSEYAKLRALALAEGGDPGMALRAELAEAMSVATVLEETIFFGINANTLDMDVRAWAMWESVCRSQGTSPLRTAAEARDFPERNAHLLACLLLHAFAVGRPRDRSRAFIKPRSALAYPLAIVRIFARWGVTMPSYKVLKAAVSGIARFYLAYYGPMSLAPKRAEPMKFSMVRELYAIPTSGSTKVGRTPWVDDDHNVFIFRRLICVMMVTAFRLGEIVSHTSGEIMFLTFESLTWVIGGVVISHPTPAQLAAMRPGRDGARLAPPRSKPDQTGEIHCPFGVVLTYHPDDPINAAAALRDLELRVGQHVRNRGATPLFGDAGGEPYTHHFLHSMLRAALAHLYGDAVASLYSFHSFRSGLATALHAAGVEDAMIQLICRWMCPESLHVYRRMGVAEHETLIRRASGCHVDCTQAVNVPVVVGDQHMAALVAEFNQPKAMSEQRAYEQAMQAALEPFPTRAPTRGDAQEPRTHQLVMAPTVRAAPAPRVPPPEPQPEPPVALAPLEGVPTPGAELALPRTMWPSYQCDELGGQGWKVLVLAASPATATVRFVHARHQGRPYEDVQVQTSSLMLIKPLDTLDQQGP